MRPVSLKRFSGPSLHPTKPVSAAANRRLKAPANRFRKLGDWPVLPGGAAALDRLRMNPAPPAEHRQARAVLGPPEELSRDQNWVGHLRLMAGVAGTTIGHDGSS